ncbi:uncharacterized protein DS421_3g74150 [Arachis hypogaea]|nr:uncharacterized protein DS421_3g74150 [Arachis hypogaea]
MNHWDLGFHAFGFTKVGKFLVIKASPIENFELLKLQTRIQRMSIITLLL